MENIDKSYTGRNVYVRIARRPLIMPLDNFGINSAKSTVKQHLYTLKLPFNVN